MRPGHRIHLLQGVADGVVDVGLRDQAPASVVVVYAVLVEVEDDTWVLRGDHIHSVVEERVVRDIHRVEAVSFEVEVVLLERGEDIAGVDHFDSFCRHRDHGRLCRIVREENLLVDFEYFEGDHMGPVDPKEEEHRFDLGIVGMEVDETWLKWYNTVMRCLNQKRAELGLARIKK